MFVGDGLIFCVQADRRIEEVIELSGCIELLDVVLVDAHEIEHLLPYGRFVAGQNNECDAVEGDPVFRQKIDVVAEHEIGSGWAQKAVQDLGDRLQIGEGVQVTGENGDGWSRPLAQW